MICKKCGKDKGEDEFYDVSHKFFSPIDGHVIIYVYKRTTCIPCVSEYHKQYHLKKKYESLSCS
jgi:hypothetical protein